MEFGWQFHLPYRTKGGNNAYFVIATGPHVSVNTILGLPFMQATGMIIDLVGNVAECKHLNCLPFTIDFRRMSNHVPVMDKPNAYAKVHKVELFNHVIKEIENLERYYEAKVQADGSKIISKTLTVHFGSKPQTYPPNFFGWGGDDTTSSLDNGASLFSDTPNTPMAGDDLSSRWVPPASVNKDGDYHSSVLKNDGYM